MYVKKENKKITVNIFPWHGDYVKICIEGNGIGRKKSAELAKKKLLKKESFGIKLTNERMNMFYSEKKIAAL